MRVCQRNEHDGTSPHFQTGSLLVRGLDGHVCYGIAMAILSFVPFILVLFVFEDGQLGYKCNAGYSEVCDGVFRARATCYATLTFLILSHAINCRDIRQSG